MNEALLSLDTLMQADPLPLPACRTTTWAKALTFSAERRYDHKPSCYVIDVRQLARLLRQSARAILERLCLEYPLGWLCDAEQQPLQLDAALPPHIPLSYWLPLYGGAVLQLGHSAQWLSDIEAGAKVEVFASSESDGSL